MKIAFGEARSLCKQASAEISQAIAGPAVKPRFDGFEQSVRNQMASMIRATRDAAKAHNVSEEAQLRLYGPKQAEADIATAKRAARAMAGASDEDDKGPGGLKGLLKDLKGDFGKTSTLGQITKLAAGGGVIMGLSMVTSEVQGMAQQAEKFATAIRSGDDGAGDMGRQLASSIPVLGHIVSAGFSIREIITGEKAEIQKITADTTKMAAAIDVTRDAWKRSVAEARNVGETIAHLRGEMKSLGAGEISPFFGEFGKNIGQAASQADSEIAKINETIEKQLGGEGIKTIDDLRRRVEAARAAAMTPIPEPNIVDMGPSGKQDLNFAAIQDAKETVDNARSELQRLVPTLKQFQSNIASAEASGLQIAANATILLAAQYEHAGAESGKHFLKGFTTWITGNARATTAAMADMAHQMELDAIALGNELNEQAADRVGSFHEEIKNRTEKAKEQQAELRDWVREGLIDTGEFGRGMARLDEVLHPRRSDAGVNFIKPNTAEAINYQFNQKRDQDDQVRRQIDIATEQLKALEDIQQKFSFEVINAQ
jgi:hypothetical protein